MIYVSLPLPPRTRTAELLSMVHDLYAHYSCTIRSIIKGRCVR